MAVVINGSGTVTGISVGGLPDDIVDSGTLANDAVGLAQMASGTDGNVITYDTSGNPAVNPHGFHFHLSKDQGYLSMYEVGYRSNQDVGDKGLPGHYRIGGWHHSGNFSDHDGLTTHGDNWGLYFAADRMLWREQDEQGLGLFYRVGGSPHNRNQFEWAMDGGLSYQGLLPGRDDDIAGLGVAFAKQQLVHNFGYNCIANILGY